MSRKNDPIYARLREWQKETFSRNLKRIRQEKGLTQTALATMCKMRPGDINRYENRKHLPRLDATVMIADVLGVTVDDLYS